MAVHIVAAATPRQVFIGFGVRFGGTEQAILFVAKYFAKEMRASYRDFKTVRRLSVAETSWPWVAIGDLSRRTRR